MIQYIQFVTFCTNYYLGNGAAIYGILLRVHGCGLIDTQFDLTSKTVAYKSL